MIQAFNFGKCQWGMLLQSHRGKLLQCNNLPPKDLIMKFWFCFAPYFVIICIFVKLPSLFVLNSFIQPAHTSTSSIDHPAHVSTSSMGQSAQPSNSSMNQPAQSSKSSTDQSVQPSNSSTKPLTGFTFHQLHTFFS